MTMTTEKLAGLLESCENGIARITREDLASLIALAERALQPEEGQALPELPEPSGWRIRNRSEPGMVGNYAWTYFGRKLKRPPSIDSEIEELFTADQMHAYARASQLALPAGPVPEGWKLVPIEPTKEMLKAANNAYEEDAFGGKGAWPSDIYASMLKAVPKHFIFSPAVAQPVPAGPVPDPKHALQFLEQYGKNLEAAGFSSGDALKACQVIFETKVSASPAVAQPVADERGWKWRDNPVAWYTLYKDGTRQILGYTKPSLADLVRELGKQAEDAVSRPLVYGDAARAALCQPAEEGGKS